MAVCSSSVGFLLSVRLQEEVVLGSARIQSSMIPNVRTMKCSKKSGNLLYNRSRRSQAVVNSLNSENEPQSGDGVTIASKEIDGGSIGKDFLVLEANYVPVTDSGSGGGGDVDDGNNGNGKFLGGGGGGGGGDNEGDDDKEEEEFGPIMKFEEVIKETEARGATLPQDMLEAAKSVGIRKVLLLRYLDLQGSAWPVGFAMKSCSMLRNRMLADPAFLFKVGTEVYSAYLI